MTSPDLFRLVFRYVNRGPTSVSGRVSVREEGKFATCANCECGGATPTSPPPATPTSAHTSVPPSPAPPGAHMWVGRPSLSC